MLRRILALPLVGAGLAHADSLTPAGSSSQGLCYALGSTGPRVPCVQQDRTWTRLLRPTDPADGLTVGGSPIAAILGGKASSDSPVFRGVARAQSVKIAPSVPLDLAVVMQQRLSGASSDAYSGNYLSLEDAGKMRADATSIFWNMEHHINAGVSGHRQTMQLLTTFNGADGGWTRNPYYVTVFPTMSVTAGGGGQVDKQGKLTYGSG